MNSPLQKYLGQTVEVQGKHSFDVARLDTYLGDVIRGYEGPLTVKQFDGGQSNFTYLLKTPKIAYVLRRKPPGKLLKSAHAVEREFRIMAALGDVGFLVPEVYDLCEDESVIGSSFYVMEYIPGRVFLDSSMPDLSREDRAAIYDSVNATLAQLHRIDFRAIGLEDYGRPGNYFARQIARWVGQYEESKTETIPEMEKLVAWLPANVPEHDGRASVVHGDFSFHNMLIHPTEPRVVGVLDWELSTIGHPLGDLMYHLAEWYRPAGVDPRGTLGNKNLTGLGIPSMEEYARRYADRAGVTLPDDLAFYRAFNLFRQAAILQGIAGRVRDGTANASNAAQLGASVRPLAKAAWLQARAAGA